MISRCVREQLQASALGACVGSSAPLAVALCANCSASAWLAAQTRRLAPSRRAVILWIARSFSRSFFRFVRSLVRSFVRSLVLFASLSRSFSSPRSLLSANFFLLACFWCPVFYGQQIGHSAPLELVRPEFALLARVQFACAGHCFRVR